MLLLLLIFVLFFSVGFFFFMPLYLNRSKADREDILDLGELERTQEREREVLRNDGADDLMV